MPLSLETPDYMRLLPPQTLGRIGRLELVARGLVEGFVTGRHKSPFKGASVEFAEHRQYVPGDDTRTLDWRLYGKTDRYYVKQFVEETNMRVTIVLDASGSMGYAGDKAAKLDGKPASKFAYAQHLAAALTYLLVHQQDAVGLVTFDTETRRYFPARARASQVRILLEELNQTHPGKETAAAEILHDIAERIPRRGLVIVISDLFDDVAEIVRALHHFRYRKHEVLLLHVMADEELTFPFEKWSDFRDLEMPASHAQLDPKAVRAAYLAGVEHFLKELEIGCGRMKVDYVPLNTKEPYDIALADFLADRKGR